MIKQAKKQTIYPSEELHNAIKAIAESNGMKLAQAYILVLEKGLENVTAVENLTQLMSSRLDKHDAHSAKQVDRLAALIIKVLKSSASTNGLVKAAEVQRDSYNPKNISEDNSVSLRRANEIENESIRRALEK